MPFLFFACALVAVAFFILLNVGAAGAAIVGLCILLALGLMRKSGFWALLTAMPLLLSGLGALSGAWGGYYAAMHWWPESFWPTLCWMGGYMLGGALGTLIGFFAVLRCRRHELPFIQSVAKMRYGAVQHQLVTLGFRQTLRVGAWQLRLAIFKRAKASN